MELHQIALGTHGSLGELCALLYALETLFLLAGHGGDRAVVHAVKLGDGSGDGGEHIVLLHALAHHTGYKLREQHRGLRGAEELLHHVGAAALDMDIEALELPLEGVQALQGGTPIIFAGVGGLQHLREGLPGLAVHTLFQSHIVVSISHSADSSLLK